MTTGLLPLSADPITFGHIDLITRAASRCDTLIVLIADNDAKRGRYTFTLTERVAMTRRALNTLKNVEVHSSTGLLVDAFIQYGCERVFRGIRNETDQAYEAQQMAYHDLLLPGFSEHVEFLPARQELREISSSLVKALTTHHVDISPFVPLFVKAVLEERLLGRHLIGITGEMASGKSYVAGELATRLGATHINFDQLIRDLYVEATPGAQKVRDTLATLLGPDVLMADGKEVDRDALKARLFDPHCPNETRSQIHALTTPHVLRLYRKALAQAKGLVIVEWAQLAEMNMSAMVSGNAIVVEATDRKALADKRKIDATTLKRIGKHQWSAQQKIEVLQATAERHSHGHVIHYLNDLDPKRSARGLDRLAETLKTLFNLEKA